VRPAHAFEGERGAGIAIKEERRSAGALGTEDEKTRGEVGLKQDEEKGKGWARATHNSRGEIMRQVWSSGRTGKEWVEGER